MKLYKLLLSLCLLLSCLTMPVFAETKPENPEEGDCQSVRVPILMYHGISKSASLQGKTYISPGEMEADLKFLQKNGFETVVMDDLIRFVNDGAPLPEKPVMLTFDDGNYSDIRYLKPLLETYDMRAVLSIIGKPTDAYSADGRTDINHPHLTWTQLKELRDCGRMELQNHSYALHYPRACCRKPGESLSTYQARFSGDVSRMQKRFEEELNLTPTTFTYPLGNLSSESEAVLKELGFTASLSCFEGMNLLVKGQPETLYVLKRVNRAHNRSAAAILAKLGCA